MGTDSRPRRRFSRCDPRGALLGLVAVGLLVQLPPGTLAEPASGSSPSEDGGGDYVWRLPEGYPPPRVPADNPMSEPKVELGRRLFYDTRLSRDGTVSCATCHAQALAFTDGQARSIGVTGELHPKSAMSLANVGYAVSLTWDDARVVELEEQLLTPLFGHEPVEMGLDGPPDLEARLAGDSALELQFESAFPEAPTVSTENAAKALAAFQRTLISGDSAFDRYLYGQREGALGPSARRGMRLFFSSRLGCSECHGRFLFQGPVHFDGSLDHKPEFHNTGLYDLGDGRYPAENPGLVRHTDEAADRGRFKTPSLRNVAVTAPYMHDGSILTLEAVLEHYAAGGRAPLNPYKSPALTGFTLGCQERDDLVAFLRALTDERFLGDPRFAPPPGAGAEAGAAGARAGSGTAGR
ncbi:MAG: MbnH family di-heme enzyme [Acidobacteriota bacterium]